MCRLRWISSDVGGGASKSCVGASMVGDVSVSSGVVERVSIESHVVMS